MGFNSIHELKIITKPTIEKLKIILVIAQF